jgi:cell division protein ZapB
VRATAYGEPVPASLSTERAQLIEKNEQARARVEAMISRLKAMENS